MANSAETVSIEVDPAIVAELEQAAQEGNTWFKCGTCGDHFNDLNLLLAHLQVHRGDELAQGGFEGETTIQLEGQEVESYQCGECGLQFYTQTACEDHIREAHSGEVGSHVVIRADDELYNEQQRLRIYPTPHELVEAGGTLQLVSGEPLPPEFLPIVVAERLPLHVDKRRLKKLIAEDASASLATPRVRHYPRQQQVHRCTFCTETFTDRALYTAHMRRHGKAGAPLPRGTAAPRALEEIAAATDAEAFTSAQMVQIEEEIKSIKKTTAATAAVAAVEKDACMCQVCGKKLATWKGLRRHLSQLHKDLGVSKMLRLHERARAAMREHIASEIGGLPPGSVVVLGEDELGGGGAVGGDVNEAIVAAESVRRVVATKTIANIEASTRPNACEFCGQRFIMKKSLAKHIEDYHQNEERQAVVAVLPAPESPSGTMPHFVLQQHAVQQHHQAQPSSQPRYLLTGAPLAQVRSLAQQQQQQMQQQQRQPTHMQSLAAALEQATPSHYGRTGRMSEGAEPGQQVRKPVDFYRCQRCQRQFLTTFGLERHTKLAHADEANELLSDIHHERGVATYVRDKNGAMVPVSLETSTGANVGSIIEGGGTANTISSGSGRPIQMPPSVRASMPFSSTPASRRQQAMRAQGTSLLTSAQLDEKLGVDWSSTITREEQPPDESPVARFSGTQRTQFVGATQGAGDTSYSTQQIIVAETAEGQIYVCPICSLQLFQIHAIQAHMRAHQKNEELRQILLREHGQEAVMALTCVQCKVVFRDTRALDQHIQTMHKGQQVLECHLCGNRFHNRPDLANHVRVAHNAPPPVGITTESFFECHSCRRKFISEKSLVNHCTMTRHLPPPNLGLHIPASTAQFGGRRSMMSGDQSYLDAEELEPGLSRSLAAAGLAMPPAPPVPEPEEMQCRSTCDICGIVLARPSNLIRHMKGAHNRTNFTATVETKGMPSFKIDVCEGKFTWGCCDDIFEDRLTFIQHRRTAHGKPGAPAGATPDAPGRDSTPSPTKTTPRAVAPQPTPASEVSGMAPPPSMRCMPCGGRTFATVKQYMMHQRTHKTRVCRVCDRTFGSSTDELHQYYLHLLAHKREGHVIRMSAEMEDRLRAIETRGEPEAGAEPVVSEDDVSVFSESGVESDAEREDSDAEDDGALQTCPVCEKRFSCAYRFRTHWMLHCRSKSVGAMMAGMRTKPFSFKTALARRRCAGAVYRCSACRARFYGAVGLALHRAGCAHRRRGLLPAEATKEADDEEAAVAASRARGSRTRLTSGGEAEARRSTRTRGKDQPATSGKRKADELEDTLDMNGKNKSSMKKSKKGKRAEPTYVERAYVVQWDTRRTPAQNPYCCKTCESAFGDFLSLIQHVKSHVPKPILGSKSAAADGAEMQQACVVQIRTSTTPAAGKHPCQLCPMRFSDRMSLDEHVKTHKPHKRFRCVVCARHFWKQSTLMRHARRHNVHRGWCQVCGKKFKDYDALRRHRVVHETTNSVYQCEDCNVSYFGLESLRRHFGEKHAGIKMHACAICARIHADARSLRVHFAKEHPGARARCVFCHKRFGTPAQVAVHVRRAHADEVATRGATRRLRYTCTLCAKVYRQKAALAVHLWRHTTDAGYQCRICDLPFKDPQACRAHLKQKHDVDPAEVIENVIDTQMVYGSSDDAEALKDAARCFSCFVCGHRFGSKLLVRTHVLERHRRERRREGCERCTRRFITHGRFVDHLWRAHGERFVEPVPPPPPVAKVATPVKQTAGETKGRKEVAPAPRSLRKAPLAAATKPVAETAIRRPRKSLGLSESSATSSAAGATKRGRPPGATKKAAAMELEEEDDEEDDESDEEEEDEEEDRDETPSPPPQSPPRVRETRSKVAVAAPMSRRR